jgi:hypothetical protein
LLDEHVDDLRISFQAKHNLEEDVLQFTSFSNRITQRLLCRLCCENKVLDCNAGVLFGLVQVYRRMVTFGEPGLDLAFPLVLLTISLCADLLINDLTVPQKSVTL